MSGKDTKATPARFLSMAFRSSRKSTGRHRPGSLLRCAQRIGADVQPLFESLAGGAFIICDENPFAKRHFGDKLLYIDATLPTAEVFDSVNGTSVDQRPSGRRAGHGPRCPGNLPRAILARQESDRHLSRTQRPAQTTGVSLRPERCESPRRLLLLMPEYDAKIVTGHIASVKTQRYVGCQPVLLMDEKDLADHGDEIRACGSVGKHAMHSRRQIRGARSHRGRAVACGSARSSVGDSPVARRSMFCFVAPDEELFSEHIQSLAGALERDPAAGVACTIRSTAT